MMFHGVPFQTPLYSHSWDDCSRKAQEFWQRLFSHWIHWRAELQAVIQIMGEAPRMDLGGRNWRFFSPEKW